MRATLIGMAAGVVLLGAYTRGVYEWGKHNCEASAKVAVVVEQKRQAEEATKLISGDNKYGQQVEQTIEEVAKVAAPEGCDAVDMGDLRVERLGGVQPKVRGNDPGAGVGKRNPRPQAARADLAGRL